MICMKDSLLCSRTAVFTLMAGVSLFLIGATTSHAQVNEIIMDSATESAVATDSATATDSGRIASPSADVVERIEERRQNDITEDTPTQKSRLARFLDENPPGPLSWNNFIQHAITYAVNNGVQPNVIVLVILFPLIASLIVASRHIIGLKGFGIYIPAVLSVALVSTGIIEGIIIFLSIVAAALLTKRVLKKYRMSYLPRTALLLWMISIGILGLLFLAPALNLVSLMGVNIFPILILVLLAENFLDAQAKTKQSAAVTLAIETIALAFVCGFILKWEVMQRFALTDPEILLLGVGVLNVLLDKFGGLRISEMMRFQSIIEEE